MKNPDRGTSLFWLGLSVLVVVQSIRLGIGTPRSPGMGFFAFCASGLLGVLSAALFVRSTIATGSTRPKAAFAGKRWGRVIAVLVATSVYAAVLPVTGYLIGTFLLMVFIFLMTGLAWKWILASSFFSTIVTYYVFSVWLGCQFPTGILGM